QPLGGRLNEPDIPSLFDGPTGLANTEAKSGADHLDGVLEAGRGIGAAERPDRADGETMARGHGGKLEARAEVRGNAVDHGLCRSELFRLDQRVTHLVANRGERRDAGGPQAVDAEHVIGLVGLDDVRRLAGLRVECPNVYVGNHEAAKLQAVTLER